MALECARRLLPTIIAQTIQQLGFDSVHLSVLDVLVDVLDRYLTSVCQKTHSFAELDGRTVPDLDDLNMSFKDLGVNLHDLYEFAVGVEPSALAIDVPQFPACPEKIKARLAEQQSAENGDLTNQNDETRTETEDGPRTLVPAGANGTLTTPSAGPEKKPFSNETGMQPAKRMRLLPDEAMHSQYEMKSFLVSDSGSFIPLRPGIRASARCASPPSPKRITQPAMVTPVYLSSEKNKATDYSAVPRGVLEPVDFLLPNKFAKKSKKMAKDSLHKILSQSKIKKPKKIPLMGLPGHGKLPKPLKAEKALLKKPKNISKKSAESLSHVSDKRIHEMFPDDITHVDGSTHVDKELQKSRISSYEDSILSVIMQSSQGSTNYGATEFKNLSPLPPITRPEFIDGRGSPEDNFYLSLDATALPSQIYKFDQQAAERDAHINTTIEEVIKASSIDDDLRMSPEPDDSEAEIEPKQSAVEDIFDVSSVPSPKIPATWSGLEEEVVEETEMIEKMIEKDEFKAASSTVSFSTPVKNKSKKSKHETYEQFIPGLDSLLHVKNSDDRTKKSKHRPVERPFFDLDPQTNWTAPEEWEKKSKRSTDRSSSAAELELPKELDDLDKKSKHRSSERLLLDSSPVPGKSWSKKTKHNVDRTAVNSDALSRSSADEMNKKAKHRAGDDVIASRKENEDKKLKRRLDRPIVSATPEPLNDVKDRFDHIPAFAMEKNVPPLIAEWPKVRLETVAFEEGKKDRLKRPFSVSPTPPLPLGLSFPMPPSELQSNTLSSDSLSQPPLKRIKIISSSGYSNQFEIQHPSELEVKDKNYRHDKKDKKKAKRSRDRDRSHGHKEKERGHDHKGQKDRERSHKDRERTHDYKEKDRPKKESDALNSNFDMFPFHGHEDKNKKKFESSVPDKAGSHVFEDWSRREIQKQVQYEKTTPHSAYEDVLVKEKQVFSERIALHGSVEDFGKKAQDKTVGRNILNAYDEKFAGATDLRMDFSRRSEDWTRDKSRERKDVDLEKQRNRDHKKKDKSRSYEEVIENRKEEKLHEKSTVKSEHKKKRSDKKHEKEVKTEELPPEPAPLQLPTVPKITLKFSGTSSGTPSLARTTEPPNQPALRAAEQPPVTNPPIKLRFKTGFSSLPAAVSAPASVGPSYFGDASSVSSRSPSAKVPVQPRQPPSLLEIPTFSPSPESIFIPSPNDSSDRESEPTASGRVSVRTPTPPSLSIPGPPISKPHIPFCSSSSSSNHSLSPPLLHLSQDIDSRKASSRKSSLNPKAGLRLTQTPKMETSTRASAVSKASHSSKLPSTQKTKSSSKTSSSPKALPHYKGIPPSKIMPPATPVQSLLSPAKTTMSSSKSGASSKAKKRVTTETVSKVVNENGVITWICPACTVEDKGEEPMIGCDECDDWYHWKCVGVLVEPPEEIPWYCRRCQEKSKVLSKTPSSGRGRGKKSKKK